MLFRKRTRRDAAAEAAAADFEAARLRAEAARLDAGAPPRIDPVVRARLKSGGGDGPKAEIEGPVLRDVILGKKPSPIPELISGGIVEATGVRVKGPVELKGEEIARNLYFTDCVFEQTPNFMDARTRLLGFWRCRFETGLSLHRVNAGGPVIIDYSESLGDVDVMASVIDGQFSADSAYIHDAGDNWALCLESAHVKGDVTLGHGFFAYGGVSLFGARVEGRVECSGAWFFRSHRRAFSLAAAMVEGDVVYKPRPLSDNIRTILGEARLARHRQLEDVEGAAVFFPECTGEFDVSGARIGGRLEMRTVKLFCDLMPGNDEVEDADDAARAARLRELVKRETAINLRGADVRGDVQLNGFSKIYGVADMVGLKCGGQGEFAGARFVGPMVLTEAEITRQLNLYGARFHDVLDLTGAGAAELVDGGPEDEGGPEAFWPAKGDLRLHGFVYERIGSKALYPFAQRCDWLFRQPEEDLGRAFRPQPWTRLAAVMRSLGYETMSRRLSIKREEYRRRSLRVRGQPLDMALFNIARQTANRLMGTLIGFGYNPWKGVAWSVGAIIAGAFVFAHAHGAGIMAPADSDVLRPGEAEALYVSFNPLAYSIDVFIPVVDLAQHRYRIPDGGWVTGWYWFQRLFGALMLPLVGLALAGVLRRED